MKNILFLFLDGVGLGPGGSDNPFSEHDGRHFFDLSGEQFWTRPFSPRTTETHVVRSIDATLGVDGLPQSGTGQASLFTGINCAQIVGRHFGPFPHSKTYEAIDQSNLFTQVSQEVSDKSPRTAFANAFPPQYFERERTRATVTTRCCEAAGVPVRGIKDLKRDRALSADLTGRAWRQLLDLDIPSRTPGQAGSILASIAKMHRVTLFEYFLTDKVGHGRIDVDPQDLLSALNAFLGAIIDSLDPSQHTLIITSDHGNMEVGSHTQHTRNPVPLIVYGWAAPSFTAASSLTDVTPGILRALSNTTVA